ncbi:UNVERIFIED_CONTAM: QacE family quaternary ammonium compound efflux SMR transporter, partial [Salmonella enterica subsp. enterica serovar Weltevreden]
IGLVFYGQTLDLAAVAGIGLIVAGVLVLSLLSKSTVHA